MKNPLILAGIKPSIFRFVAQHLNYCATAVPKSEIFHLELVEGNFVTDALFMFIFMVSYIADLY